MVGREKDTHPPRLNLPSFPMKIIRSGDTVKIFDTIRKKYVALTPEEYVRQHFVNWLCQYLHYPSSLVANEVFIRLNGTDRRCDTVVFYPASNPLMIIEYKSPSISISQGVFDQIVRYNMVLKAKYLVVSNGINHYCCKIDYKNDSYHFIPSIPDYSEVIYGSRDN